MCVEDIVMPDPKGTVLCNVLRRGNQEGGGRNGRTVSHIPSLLIYALHASPAWAEDNEKQTTESGEKASAAPSAPPGRLHWVRLCRSHGPRGTRSSWRSVIHWDAEVDFSGAFSVCIYFKECLQVGHIPPNKPNYPGNVKCVFQKCVAVKTSSSRIRNTGMKSRFHRCLVMCPLARSLTPLGHTFLLLEHKLQPFPHNGSPIIATVLQGS